MRGRHGAHLPDLAAVGRCLASRGVVGVTDVTPGNDQSFCAVIAAAQASGALPQRVAVMGGTDILRAASTPDLCPLGVKVHLHEGDYPAPEDFVALAQQARDAGLVIAVHAVTAADLIYTLALLEEAGLARGARIEHASVVPADMVPLLAASGVRVVTQPHFIAERGDTYQRDIPCGEHATLYRCGSLLAAGVRVGGGSDAPFGHWDPWASMAAAAARRTSGGAILGGAEAISPEAALALFTTPADDPGGTPRAVAVGEAADLCLLATSWQVARHDLAAVRVRAVWRGGHTIFTAEHETITGRKVA